MFFTYFPHYQVRLIGHKGYRDINIEAEIRREAVCSIFRLQAGYGTVSIEREMAKERVESGLAVVFRRWGP